MILGNRFDLMAGLHLLGLRIRPPHVVEDNTRHFDFLILIPQHALAKGTRQ